MRRSASRGLPGACGPSRDSPGRTRRGGSWEPGEKRAGAAPALQRTKRLRPAVDPWLTLRPHRGGRMTGTASAPATGARGTVDAGVVLAIAVAALGYFVDVFDILLYGIVRVASLRDLGVPAAAQLETGVSLLN